MAENEPENPTDTESQNESPEGLPEEQDGGKPDELRKRGARYIFGEIWGMVKILFGIFWDLLRLVIRLEDTTDAEGTVNTVKSGIELKGYNIWILVASAILASIGLDTNSVAVIIGAMLISPLMSPILGIGLSVGINDRQMLYRSLYNFLVAIGISLGTAVLYFMITPLGRETTEMAARTHPTLLDVGVAFFGGVAGIVAGSRKDKTNAIPGVAIATALMPPICVAGYGLASLNFSYFAGAFYLFFLNSVFISLSTFLIVRFLNFPLVERVSAGLRKNFMRGVVFFVVITLVPATWVFIDVIRDLQRDSAIEAFLYDHFDSKLDYTVQTKKLVERDSVNILRVSIQGPFVPDDSISKFEELLVNEYGLKETSLMLSQSAIDPNDGVRLKQEMRAEFEGRLKKYEEDRLKREAQAEEIRVLKAEVERLRKDTLPIENIRDEIRDWVEGVGGVEIGVLTASDFSQKTESDRYIFTLILDWHESVPMPERVERARKIKARLRNIVPMDSIAILSLPSLQIHNQLIGPVPKDPAKEEEED